MSNELKMVDIKGLDNVKGMNFDFFGGFENFLALTSNDGGGTVSQQLITVIPWLAKAMTMTANAASSLPFDILNSDNKVVDSSLDWKNKLGAIPSPENLFYLIAGSLCGGKAYITFTKTSTVLATIQYFAPQTITENIDINGVQSFNRAGLKGNAAKYYPTDKKQEPSLLYFWLPDPSVEIGPARTSPMSTALLSAKLLCSMDAAIQGYADSGFIQPVILGMDGMPDQPEKEKTEHWWDNFFFGKDKSKPKVKIFNSKAMTVQQVGAGMKDFSGSYGELNKQSIENIGTAFGIPAALFMSDMAFASEVNPMIKIWYTTSQFKLIYQTIESTFNNQLLNQFNLHMKFKPETIDAFKDDQLNNQQAFSGYVSSGIKRSTAATLAGLKLPDGVTPEMLDEEKPEEVKLVAANIAPVVEKPVIEPAKSLTTKEIKELALWSQISTRCFKNNKGKAIDFECKSISDDMAFSIREKLQKANSLSDISKAFEFGESKYTEYDGLKELADAINNAVK